MNIILRGSEIWKGSDVKMQLSIITPVLVVLILATSSATFENCRHNITKTQNIWNCSYTFKLDFPKKETIPAGTDTYDLSFNRILELHRINSTCKSVHSCDGCLRNLYLHHNDIDTVDNNAFKNLHCLHTLDLSYNKISGASLTEMTFDGLLQLEVLSLKGNPLVKLKDFTLRFNELRILKTLDLSDCELAFVGEHAFDDLNLLEKIDLSGNQLHTIDPPSFRGLSFLEVLDLSRNKFSTIQQSNFLALIRLQKLFLDGNTIETLPDDAFKGIENLEFLLMSDNWLQGIPYNALKGLQSLRVLDISRNNVKHLKPSNWPKDINLRVHELYINDMNHGFRDIEYGAFVSFPLLRKISITGNKELEVIAYNAFTGNTQHIKEVYLSNNSLEYMAEHLLPWDDLEVLELNGNPWKCDCRLRWVLEGDFFSNHTIRCHSPAKLRNQNLLKLSPLDLRCPRSLIWILLTFALGVGVLVIILTSFILWKHRQKLPCHRVKGRYISVYTKDVEEENEGRATINLSEDEMPLKDMNV